MDNYVEKVYAGECSEVLAKLKLIERYLGYQDRIAKLTAIERGMAIALALPIFLRYPEIGFHFDTHLKVEALLAAQVHVSQPFLAMVYPQVWVGQYRVDFFVVFRDLAGSARGVVVECDGHDFHERTKAQAARDRARDRYFASRDFHVLRFTGSEIHNDPVACAQAVITHITDRILLDRPAEGIAA